MAKDMTIRPEDQDDEETTHAANDIDADIDEKEQTAAKPHVSTPSPKKTQPAVDDSDLDIDLSTPTPTPRKTGGCRGVTGILFILLLAVAAGSIYYSIETKKAREAEEQARVEREASYKVQFSAVSNNIQRAVEASTEGDTEKALAYLAAAEAQLTIIGTRANDFNDQQWAYDALNKKQALLEAKGIIAEQYAAYKEAVREQFMKLSSKFEGVEYTGDDAEEAVVDEDMPTQTAPEATPEMNAPAAPDMENTPVPAPEMGAPGANAPSAVPEPGLLP